VKSFVRIVRKQIILFPAKKFPEKFAERLPKMELQKTGGEHCRKMELQKNGTAENLDLGWTCVLS